MNTITFLLAVHNHQPIGNFDSVMERVYQEAYAPFLAVLERHLSVRIAAHTSGCLLDWLEDRHPDYLDRLGALVERGQVEILGGAYYEPILPAIPEEDRQGQLRKLSQALTARFRRTPRGAWIAERVWEPDLAGSLHRAGIRYTFLDDTHFLSAGADPASLDGPFLTEDRGHTLAVFPISKKLRYLVPFRPPEETVAFLREEAGKGPGRVFFLGDDGEKFGHWPDTHALVYEQGWLERFFTLLEENQAWLRTGFPGEHAGAWAARGRIYLPTAAYEEMGEWTLPPRLQGRFHAFRERVRQSDPGNEHFLRGGTWRAYLARYPESDRMSQRGLRLGEEALVLASENPSAHDEVKDLLWAAQCNCAYWHGVFGGIYLPHLRDAVWNRLLAAESRLLDARRREGPWTEAIRMDLDADGELDVLLRNDRVSAVIDPDQGGALVEFSLRRPALPLGNGLSRRYEAYHDRLLAGTLVEAGGSGPASIHDRLRSKEPDLAQHLQIDAYPRVSLVDHAFDPGATREAFEAGRLPDPWGMRRSYQAAVAEIEAASVVAMRRTAQRDGAAGFSVEKVVRLHAGTAGLEVEYCLHALASEVELGFGVEWNLALLDAKSAARRWVLSGQSEERSLASRGEASATGGAIFTDGERGFRVELRWNPPAELWWTPVETVSLSESGLERVYQSTALLPWWRVALGRGQDFRLRFNLDVVTIP